MLERLKEFNYLHKLDIYVFGLLRDRELSLEELITIFNLHKINTPLDYLEERLVFLKALGLLESFAYELKFKTSKKKNKKKQKANNIVTYLLTDIGNKAFDFYYYSALLNISIPKALDKDDPEDKSLIEQLQDDGEQNFIMTNRSVV